MSDLISQAENALLRPADLTPDAVASVLGTLVAAPGVDAADLYFQHQIRGWCACVVRGKNRLCLQ